MTGRDGPELLALARALGLPEPVQEGLASAAARLPWEELPVELLADPGEACGAWERLLPRLAPWQEDGGMEQLAVQLAAACRAWERYRQAGIPGKIFLDTMGCFPRFLRETHRRTGKWCYDRAFWSWRQSSGILFRLGTLEFECHRLDAGRLPPGASPSGRILSVHIPSDAELSRQRLDEAYRAAAQFFPGPGRLMCPGEAPGAVVCGSWLLAPALDGLLPEDSGIRRFAGDYERYFVNEGDQEFYEWVFGGYAPAENLPEHTSLQRKIKARLRAGGKLGMARGVLRTGLWD